MESGGLLGFMLSRGLYFSVAYMNEIVTIQWQGPKEETRPSNQSPEPTSTVVMPAACASVTPTALAAHL